MSEANKAMVHRLIEGVWDRGDVALVDELIAVDCLGHAPTPADETHGREGYRQYFASLREAFTDVHFTVEDQIADGDKVVTPWTARATHIGAFRDIPPPANRGV